MAQPAAAQTAQPAAATMAQAGAGTDPAGARGALDPRPAPSLEAALAQALEALTILDAPALESLAEVLAGSAVAIARPRSPEEWERVRRLHWILRHLLTATAGRLAMLRRIALAAADAAFAAYPAGTGSAPRATRRGAPN